MIDKIDISLPENLTGYYRKRIDGKWVISLVVELEDRNDVIGIVGLVRMRMQALSDKINSKGRFIGKDAI